VLGQAEAREKLGRAEGGDLFDPRGWKVSTMTVSGLKAVVCSSKR
jgi:hypothetical protein